MSDIQVERRIKTQRVRSLGDATPIYRAGETAANKTAGEKTHGEIDKTMTERFAEMRDAAEITTRCAIDDCLWVHVGPAGEARQIALAHRQDAHQHIEKGVRRCTTPGCTGRAVRNLAVCGRCHKTGRRERATTSSMRARGLNRDGTRLLEEAASADGDVGAVAAASSSSQLARLAAGESAGPSGHARVEPGHGPVATEEVHVPRASQPAASTITTRREPMRRTWTRESMIAAVQEAANEVGHTPTQRDLQTRKLSSLFTKSFLLTKGFDDYASLCAAAGLTRNTSGRHAAAQAPAQAPARAERAPAPAPAPLPAVREEHGLRDPIRTADIPYDADVLESEVVEQIAAGIRRARPRGRGGRLAGLDTERAA